VQHFCVRQFEGKILGKTRIFFYQPDLNRFSQQLSHAAPHKATTQNHHPVALLLFDPCYIHQAGQVLVAGQKKGLILGQKLFFTAGDQRGDSPCNRNYPERKFRILFRNIFQFPVSQRRFLMNAGGHDLDLPLGHIDYVISGP